MAGEGESRIPQKEWWSQPGVVLMLCNKGEKTNENKMRGEGGEREGRGEERGGES
jgi:hypothetical protein